MGTQQTTIASGSAFQQLISIWDIGTDRGNWEPHSKESNPTVQHLDYKTLGLGTTKTISPIGCAIAAAIDVTGGSAACPSGSATGPLAASIGTQHDRPQSNIWAINVNCKSAAIEVDCSSHIQEAEARLGRPQGATILKRDYITD